MAKIKAVEDAPNDPLEDATDEAISLAGGDLRAAVRGLILGQQTYEEELQRTVSAGYVRRGIKGRSP